MKENILEYKIHESSKIIYEIIVSEINNNVFKKQFNLSGDISSEHSIEVYDCVSLIVFKPNLGPLIKLKVNFENINNKEKESLLKIERINGFSFYVQYWFSLIFVIVTLIISLYLIITTGFENNTSFFLPLMGMIYFYIVKLIASSTYKGLTSKIESILKKEKIRFIKI